MDEQKAHTLTAPVTVPPAPANISTPIINSLFIDNSLKNNIERYTIV